MTILSRAIFLLCAVMIIPACSPLDLLNATVSHDGYLLTPDVAYGDQPRQRLDIYVPAQARDTADVVLFFYGGRWQSGSKDLYGFVADAFTAQGMITVIADYRLYPAVDWREFINDGHAAFQWVRDNIADYHGNPNRVFVMGHSAGAHIAAMVTMQDNTAAQRPCGLIGLAGPYDFLPIDQPDIQKVFASAPDLQDTQPIHFASADDPAMLLLHGSDDTTVKPGNSSRLAERINQLGGKATLKMYDAVDHTDILVSLSSTFRSSSPALADSIAFIHSTTCR